jgi:hypothetical protein
MKKKRSDDKRKTRNGRRNRHNGKRPKPYGCCYNWAFLKPKSPKSSASPRRTYSAYKPEPVETRCSRLRCPYGAVWGRAGTHNCVGSGDCFLWTPHQNVYPGGVEKCSAPAWVVCQYNRPAAPSRLYSIRCANPHFPPFLFPFFVPCSWFCANHTQRRHSPILLNHCSPLT